MDKPIEHSHEAARGSGVDRPAPHALEGYRTHKSDGQEDYLAESWGLPTADEPNDDRSSARDEKTKAAAASKEEAGKTGGEEAGSGKTE